MERHTRGKTFIELPDVDEEAGEPDEDQVVFRRIAERVMVSIENQLLAEEIPMFLDAIIAVATERQQRLPVAS